MSIKSKKVLLSFIPSRLNWLCEFGKAHQMYSGLGTLRMGTIAMNIICFVLDLNKDADIREYLDKTGGTLFDLIRRAVKEFISRQAQ